jgi:hypothetical protein
MGTLPFHRPGFTPGAKSRFKPIGPAVDQVKPAFSQQTINDLIAQFQRGEPMPGQATAQPVTPMQPDVRTMAAAGNYPAAQSTAPINNTTMQLRAAASQLGSPVAQRGNSNVTTPGKGDVYDGFARRYVPGEMDMIMSNPDIVLHDYLGQDGKADYSNLEGDLSRYAGDSLDLYNLLIGGNMDPNANKNDAIINWMASLFGNLSTPGGATPTTQQMLGQLYAGLNDPKSAIYANTMLDNNGQPLDTAGQISAVMKMIPLLGEFSNYGYSQALQKQAGRLATQYASNVANGKAGGKTFAQYLQDNYLR